MLNMSLLYSIFLCFFLCWVPSLTRKSAFLEESESVDSDPQHFHLVGDFVIKEKEIKR